MRPHAEHRRGGRGGRRRPAPSGARVGALAGAGLSALALAAAAHGAAQKGPTVVRDAAGDVGSGGLDVARVAVGRSPDGRVRASLTLAAAWSPRDLLARDGGPPGTLCVRIWLGTRRPSASVPDYLVCATVAADNDKLKASVLHERRNDLPERAAAATATKVSARTAVLRFSQSALGRPDVLRFGIETRPAGCSRPACVDTAPDAPKSARFALR